ncbi:hypothetical protein QAD02_014854 [Eretmocerus hayati]|uniref:Uncharacterized protein n=1 Tax=Eretmocerus hayati TaxID=131215 RepID=A0ACC2P6M5_9HYME|nr:hypothetical protein QAD02_014854 [Eretmocerus hayati]
MDLETYKTTLSDRQRKLVLAVEEGDFYSTHKQIENLLQQRTDSFRDKGLDFVILTISLERDFKDIIRILLYKNVRMKPVQGIKLNHSVLYCAVGLRDISIFKKLYHQGASIFDEPDEILPTLELAMKDSQKLVVKIILDEVRNSKQLKSLAPNSVDAIAFLLASCWADDCLTLEVFLSRGYSLNIYSCFQHSEWEYFTPIHFALERAAHRATKLLLKHNVDFFHQDARGNTPVHLAFRLKGEDGYLSNFFLKKFIECTYDKELCNNLVNENGISHFLIICSMNCENESRTLRTKHLNLVKRFAEGNVDLNAVISNNHKMFPGYTALHLAVENSCLETLRVLIESGADVSEENAYGVTPLSLVCRKSRGEHDIKMMEVLVEYGARLNTWDLSNLEAAGSLSVMWSLIKMLWLKDPTDPSVIDFLFCSYNMEDFCKEGCSQLHKVMNFAPSYIGSVLIKLMLEVENVDVNEVFCNGKTALHMAVRRFNCNILRTLLNAGADVNITDRTWNDSPIQYLVKGLEAGLPRNKKKCYEQYSTRMYNTPFSLDDRYDSDEDWSFNLYGDCSVMEFIEILIEHVGSLLLKNFYVSEEVKNDMEELISYLPTEQRIQWHTFVSR